MFETFWPTLHEERCQKPGIILVNICNQGLHSSVLSQTSSNNVYGFVKHERPLINPRSLPCIISHSFKCSAMLSLTLLPTTLNKTRVKQTGLQSHGSPLFIFLCPLLKAFYCYAV